MSNLLFSKYSVLLLSKVTEFGNVSLFTASSGPPSSNWLVEITWSWPHLSLILLIGRNWVRRRRLKWGWGRGRDYVTPLRQSKSILIWKRPRWGQVVGKQFGPHFGLLHYCFLANLRYLKCAISPRLLVIIKYLFRWYFVRTRWMIVWAV